MSIKLPEQNFILITGRLTKDPNVSYTQKGTAFCAFDIASNRNYKDKNSNEWKEEATFVPIMAWGMIAERCKEKLKKGSPVHIEGRLVNSEYTDKEGKKRSSLKVLANRVQFLATISKEDKEENVDSQPISSEGSSGINDDEVPF